MRKILREALEVYVVEELGPYVVEKSGSRRSSVERREEILKVALSVLAERGYRGASMLEIAERAQASKETLYAWFRDKRGLFEELVRWQAERVDAALVPSLERDTDDPLVVLRTFAVELQSLLLERVMNLAEEPHSKAGCSVSSVHRRSLVSRIRKRFQSEFITASRRERCSDKPGRYRRGALGSDVGTDPGRQRKGHRCPEARALP
jgi:AcrR family transcriptional regulator